MKAANHPPQALHVGCACHPTPPATRLLSVDNIVDYLLANQLVPPEAFVDGEAFVYDYSRRNRNFKVVNPLGQSLLVKQSAKPHLANFRETLENEATLLRAVSLERRLEPLRPFTPTFVFHDPENLVLVTELIHPATSITKYHFNLGETQWPAEAATGCARILSSFHRAGAAAIAEGALPTLRHRLPHILEGLASLDAAFRDMGPGAAGFVEALRERGAFLSRLEEARETWRSAQGIMHADVRWDNFLLTHGAGPGGGLNLRLIDWEFVARGDPAWDVACHLSEHVRFWATFAPSVASPEYDTVRQGARFQLEDIGPFGRRFQQAYLRHAGLKGEEAKAFLARVVTYLPFVLVLIAREKLQDKDPSAWQSRLVLDIATHVEADPARRLRDWFGIGKEVKA